MFVLLYAAGYEGSESMLRPELPAAAMNVWLAWFADSIALKRLVL